MRVLALSILAVALLGLSGAGTLAAQDNDYGVTAQLDSSVVLFAREGFRPAVNVLPEARVVDTLDDGGAVRLEARLEAGVEYMIVGVCDYDCSDLDLVLLDEAGEVLEQDLEMDDVPLLSFTPVRSGRLVLEVRMPSCSTEICYFGVMAFQK
jgi:hypothetical protein